MQPLSQAIENADVVKLLDIFSSEKITVKLEIFNDRVKVRGYKSSVTTDFIANQLIRIGRSYARIYQKQECEELATLFAEKVFSPLQALVESPDNLCHPYQIAALTRINWLPPRTQTFGTSTALRHSVTLKLLDPDKY